MSAGTTSSMLNRLRSLQVGSQVLAPMGGAQPPVAAPVTQSVAPISSPPAPVGGVSPAQIPVVPTSSPEPIDLSPEEKLAVFSQVVDEVAGSAEPVVPPAPAVEPSTPTVEPPLPVEPPEQPAPVLPPEPPQPPQPAPTSSVGTSKEYLALSTPDATPVDAGSQTGVEYEPAPEISPEIESFIQQVEEHEDQLPQEVVVAGDSIQLQPAHYAAQPVVVLPYDKQTEKKAALKGPQWSIRWLLAFGQKIIKMFGGKVIYLQSSEQSRDS